MMTTDPKPVTISEEELEDYQARACGFDGLGPDEVERLIAALRESRKAEEYWHNQAYLMEGKIAEIRAVVKEGPVYDWHNADDGMLRLSEYIDRLEEVIGE